MKLTVRIQFKTVLVWQGVYVSGLNSEDWCGGGHSMYCLDNTVWLGLLFMKLWTSINTQGACESQFYAVISQHAMHWYLSQTICWAFMCITVLSIPNGQWHETLAVVFLVLLTNKHFTLVFAPQLPEYARVVVVSAIVGKGLLEDINLPDNETDSTFSCSAISFRAHHLHIDHCFIAENTSLFFLFSPFLMRLGCPC